MSRSSEDALIASLGSLFLLPFLVVPGIVLKRTVFNKRQLARSKREREKERVYMCFFFDTSVSFRLKSYVGA